MRKNPLIFAIVILSVLFTSTTFAAELIRNGGFENGGLDPWQGVNGTVSNILPGYGDYCGVVAMGHDLAQDVAETPGSDITLFSVAVKPEMSAWIRIKVSYLESHPSSGLNDIISERYASSTDWQVFDLTDVIDRTRTICGVTLIGHSGGDEDGEVHTYFDNVTLQDSSIEEPPAETPVDKVVPATVKRLKVRFNERREVTVLRVALRAEELVETIKEGPVDLQVMISQDGIASEFEADAELIDFPHRRNHVVRFIGGKGIHAEPPAEPSVDGVVQAATRFIKVRLNEKREATVLRLVLKGYELVDGIHEGPVEIQVRVVQDGVTTEFTASSELVDIPHRWGHITRLLDAGTAARVWGR